ncbi:MAG TPA: hypothetical protein VNA17_03885 [Pyrinomonadaceae bacterium]|nr:hypothetical protein [Pyrinomonadaceae bacterium]
MEVVKSGQYSYHRKLRLATNESTMDTPQAPLKVKESVRALLNGVIDYAGLFPPAALSMPEAVLNYATYRNSNYNWMLGRFVVTAARLEEFYESARDFISRDAGRTWRVTVVAGESMLEAIRLVEDFNAVKGPGIMCDTIEIRATNSSLIETATKALSRGVKAYFEIPVDETMLDLVATISLVDQRAKLRTGGITPEAFPSTQEIIRFVRVCLAANVLFKATAGLHHPIRCFRPLTYENNAPSGTMHGFLNLFLMTGFAREGYRAALLEDLMEEEFEEVFHFADQSAAWRDDYTLNIWQLERLRSHGIQSFGSCSFDEPISDLQKLGIL